MTDPTPLDTVKRSLRFWAAVRIGYGVVAIAAPRLMFKLLRAEPHPDSRGFNAFLGSRDIVVGIASLRASDRREVLDAAKVNHANEMIDSIVLAQELRAGRRADLFTIVGIAFNALGHATWIRARRLLG
ncbi:MAG: hypothetical protein M0P31_09205 [Solirubrobacteraceae bacterium]|nr:hypothetical protein [Solirubrobacteraceae bacterium]